MTAAAMLPQAARPFVAFAALLRANGFAVAPDQTQAFIAGVGLLGPRSMRDVHRAALATLAPPVERRGEFDALFRSIFMAHELAAPAPPATDEDELRAYDAGDGVVPPAPDDIEPSGAEATDVERLGARVLEAGAETAAFARLRRESARRLPRRASRRRFASPAGDQPDMRRALREAVRRDGEVMQLPVRARRRRQRRVVLLIDVSGSMKSHTEGYMRIAHALMRHAERLEAFTLGTRLTRISRAIKLRNRAQALISVSNLVADWDGGTRLGDALGAFLDIPRFAGCARGALVVVLSDGLERGGHGALTAAMERLSRLAWGVLWLSPLREDAAGEPRTEAMRAIAPFIDRLGSGVDAAHVCDELLGFARGAA